MTEKEKLEALLYFFYNLLDRVQKEQPHNQELIDRVLDNINLNRKLLEIKKEDGF